MDPELVRLVAIGMGGTVGIIGVIGWSISNVARSKALASQNQPAAEDPHRIEDLEMRVAELEERIDFTERLIGDRGQGKLGS